ncbi:MAG TPA: hypothetical protein VKB19_02270 [Pedobacter sp.]|nr:hypothetical protein [Pedobacter sp.]
MKHKLNHMVNLIRKYPFSLLLYLLTLIPWVLTLSIKFRMVVEPPQEPYQSIGHGEGLMYGMILATFVSGIFLLVTLLNLSFRQEKIFYGKLTAVLVLGTLAFYGILAI